MASTFMILITFATLFSNKLVWIPPGGDSAWKEAVFQLTGTVAVLNFFCFHQSQKKKFLTSFNVCFFNNK